MLNSSLIITTVLLGLFLIYIARSPLAKIIILILTFAAARVFFGWAWRALAADIIIIPSPGLFRLFLLNILCLSILLILGTSYILGLKFKAMGWTGDKIILNSAIGLAAGGFFFFMLSLNKTIKPENLPWAICFGFFIASWQEENIFRGFLPNYLLSRNYSKESTIIIQALIFSLAHLGFYNFMPLFNLVFSLLFAFILGLLFGFLRIYTGSQVPAFIAHGLIDVGLLMI